MSGRAFLPVALLLCAPALHAQSMLERSPNLRGTWALAAGNAAFVFVHRFEVLDGGDELRNLPTLTLALGLPLGLTAGLDYTSNSEAVPARSGGNETEYWIRRELPLGRRSAVAASAGYNTAAGSVDGAFDARMGAGPFAALGELRAFSDRFGSGRAAAAAAVGALVKLTPYLSLSGDIGRVLSVDSFTAAWSAALAAAIPGTPHTLALQVSNVGATTLQGASRGPASPLRRVRYGFAFTVPLGNGSQWSRIVRAGPGQAPPPPDDSVAAQVEIRQVAFQTRELHLRPGQSVRWVNLDPIAHTVTGDDGHWGSGLLPEGSAFVQRFDRPGRYAYHCTPHPMMTATVVVEGP